MKCYPREVSYIQPHACLHNLTQPMMSIFFDTVHSSVELCLQLSDNAESL